VRPITVRALVPTRPSGHELCVWTSRVVRAAPDGYTLFVGLWNTHVANGAMYALQYDVQKDFEPVAVLSNNPLLIVAKRAAPANDLKGLIAWLKANPEKASLGSAGIGTQAHLGSVYFQNITGTRFEHVSYRGNAPAWQDLVAGQIDMMFADPVTALPQVRAGSIKAYAVMAKSRLAAAADIPTVDEAGFPGFYVAAWFAVFAPKGSPNNVIAKFNAAVADALTDANLRTRLSDIGQEIPPRDQRTPEALGRLQKAEIDKWWPIIKAANIKAQ
jgi:tripartite-type tricarboxylate transporter receptor subunit TctC